MPKGGKLTKTEKRKTKRETRRRAKTKSMRSIHAPSSRLKKIWSPKLLSPNRFLFVFFPFTALLPTKPLLFQQSTKRFRPQECPELAKIVVYLQRASRGAASTVYLSAHPVVLLLLLPPPLSLASWPPATKSSLSTSPTAFPPAYRPAASQNFSTAPTKTR
jgi:hypothetical protein